jgi:hypothetical protein
MTIEEALAVMWKTKQKLGDDARAAAVDHPKYTSDVEALAISIALLCIANPSEQLKGFIEPIPDFNLLSISIDNSGDPDLDIHPCIGLSLDIPGLDDTPEPKCGWLFDRMAELESALACDIADEFILRYGYIPNNEDSLYHKP